LAQIQLMKNLLLCVFGFTAMAGFGQLAENVGIGVRLQIDSTRGYHLPIVIGLVPGGPAEAAGVQAGDFILQVNGQPTRDMLLADVVAMIVGEEGTQVGLVVERNGSTRNLTVARQKYQYARSFYKPASEDAFCTALATLMNDAAYDFEHTMDTTHYVDEPGAFGRRHFESHVRVPGVEKVTMARSFGTTCEITVGTFTSTDDVNVAGESLVSRIQTCFPDYYYLPVIGTSGSNSVEIGKDYEDGFEAPILQIFSTESEGTYKLALRVNGGEATRFYEIAAPAQDNDFAAALRAIYDDIPNEYDNVKGTAHVVGGTLFGGSYTWYEVSPMPPGAHDCSIVEGSMVLANGCKCRFYSGTDREAAVEAYKKLFEFMRDALGSEFVYSLERSEFDMTIPDNAEGVVIFGIKKKRSYESLPLLALVIYSESEGRYAVNMLFHDFGF
jgi:hypothetical protein